MKNNSLKCIIVLTSICLVIALALAVVNFITAPIIEKNTREANDKALRAVLPDATEFVECPKDKFPDNVVLAYRDSGGSGYAFVLTAKGYKGGKITIAVGIDNYGHILNISTVDCSTQSSGIGTRVGDESFTHQFIGRYSGDIFNVDTITSATISSKAYKNAIVELLEAFDSMKGGE